MDTLKKKSKEQKKIGKKVKKTASKPVYKNPWQFADTLPTVDEDMKLNKGELCELECRLNYSIKCLSISEPDKNELLYTIYGDHVGKKANFMRQWVRLYAVTNKKQLETTSHKYLETNGIKLTAWVQGVKEGKKGDLLTLFVLSLITGIHCCMHLKQQKYWTTLKDIPTSHVEYMQRCNVHLAYIGQDTFIELSPRTSIVSYKLFGVDNPIELEETTPAISGTLTSAEISTLDLLLKETLHTTLETKNKAESELQPHEDEPGPVLDECIH